VASLVLSQVEKRRGSLQNGARPQPTPHYCPQSFPYQKPHTNLKVLYPAIFLGVLVVPALILALLGLLSCGQSGLLSDLKGGTSYCIGAEVPLSPCYSCPSILLLQCNSGFKTNLSTGSQAINPLPLKFTHVCICHTSVPSRCVAT